MSESNSGVDATAATLNEQEQSDSPQSATQAAIGLLKKLRGQGEDYVTKPLSKAKATELAQQIGNYKHGVMYNARKKIIDEETQTVAESADKNVKATVKVDEIDQMFKDTPAIGDSPQGQDQQATEGTPPEEKKKEITPVDLKTIQTISDALHEAAAEAVRAKKKEVKPENLKAVKATANATLEAYNASIPKWALIPILLALEAIVFVLPFGGDIKAAVEKKMKKGNEEQQAEFPQE